jgi:hypothetical protein
METYSASSEDEEKGNIKLVENNCTAIVKHYRKKKCSCNLPSMPAKAKWDPRLPV